MKKSYAHPCRLWIVAAALGTFSVAAGIGMGRIQPLGRKAGLIQFDVISELNTDESYTNWVAFARYWVGRDYYAVSVVWSEPHGMGMADMKTAVVLSDKAAFRMDNELFPKWVPTNTTYPKPLGERGPFRWGGGMYEGAEMRFAEAEALARRVYVSDLGAVKNVTGKADRLTDLKMSEGADGLRRKVARLKVRAQGNRIESLELFDAQQKSLGRMKYEYERDDDVSPLTKLVADLPARPEKLGGRARLTGKSPGGEKETRQIKEVEHIYHKVK